MQEPLLRLDDFLPYRLSITSNLVSDVIASIYEALFGLRIPEWRVITVVAERQDATQQQIGRRTRMDKVTVSRAVAALHARGLLERVVNPDDGRSRRLRLTEAGRALYAEVAPQALQLETEIFGAFKPAELRSFNEMLARIDDAALALLERRRRAVSAKP